MKVEQVMSRDPYTCEPQTPVSEVATRMRELDVGMIPVCAGRKLRGMVTDRDIVIREVAEEKDPARTLAGEVMSAEVIYCRCDEYLDEASERMEQNQVRRLVVLDDECTLVGILSLRDIALACGEEGLVGQTLQGISMMPFEPIHIELDDNDDEMAVPVIESAAR